LFDSIHIDQSFISRLGHKWKRPAELTHPFKHNCESGKKKRAYIIKKPSHYLVHCHNCGYSKYFSTYLKEFHPDLYAEYLKEKKINAEPTSYKHTGEVVLAPWQFSRKEAKRLGASHYQGKPCQECDDHCTRRQVASGNCAHCKNVARYEKYHTMEGSSCRRCGLTKKYKNGVCVYFSKEARRVLGIRANPNKQCHHCHCRMTSGSYLYCKSCSQRIKREHRRDEGEAAMRLMFAESKKRLLERFGRADELESGRPSQNTPSPQRDLLQPSDSGYVWVTARYVYNEKMDQSYKAALFKFADGKTHLIPFSQMAKEFNIDGQIGIIPWLSQRLGLMVPDDESEGDENWKLAFAHSSVKHEPGIWLKPEPAPQEDTLPETDEFAGLTDEELWNKLVDVENAKQEEQERKEREYWEQKYGLSA